MSIPSIKPAVATQTQHLDMTAIQGKIWGDTSLIFHATFLEIHKINILPNSFCSEHKHSFKYNAFLVLEGEVYIEVEKNDYELVDETLLKAGDITSVPPHEFHRFRTGSKPCTLYEIYYCEPGGAVMVKDIIRKDVGGRAKRKVKRK